MSGTEGYELALAQAERWLDDQSARLDSMRSRIGTLFSVANVVAGFLLAAVVADERPQHLTWSGRVGLVAAAIALVVLCGALVSIWWPREFAFNLKPSIIIGGYLECEKPAEEGTVRRDLALHMGNAADVNQTILESLQRHFSAAAVAFVIGVFGLGVALWDVLT